MSDRLEPKPPAAWLNHLHEAGQWDRLIEVAGKSLSAEPHDADAHRHIAWGYAKLDRFAEMRPHVDFLLKDNPEEPRNHHLAAIYELEMKRHALAKPHLDFLLRNDPQSATFHYLACIYHLRCNGLETARVHIREARRFSPEWVAAAHLEIKMDGIREKKARQSWSRIHRLKETLALDPEDASVMTTIGDILLTELERPRDAEGYYRQALAIDPLDRERQGKLLDAICARSMLYRTLSLPIRTLRKLTSGTKGSWLRWLPAILFLNVILAFLAWLVAIGALFTPAVKVYEWFVLTDVARARLPRPIRAPLARLLVWPMWLRLTLAWSLIIGAWTLLFWLILNVSPLMALAVIAWIFGAHLALVALFVGIRKARARFGLWQEARQRLRESRLSLQSDPA